jgi:hypothetical protein
MTCTPKPKLASTLDTGSGSALSSAGMRPFFFFFLAPSGAAGSGWGVMVRNEGQKPLTHE